MQCTLLRWISNVGQGGKSPPRDEKTNECITMAYSSVAGVEITRIRHAVSIMFSIQLRDRHVLWADSKHNNSLFFVNVVS